MLAGFAAGSAVGRLLNQRHQEVLEALRGRKERSLTPMADAFRAVQSVLIPRYRGLVSMGQTLTTVCCNCFAPIPFAPDEAGDHKKCPNCEAANAAFLFEDNDSQVVDCPQCKRREVRCLRWELEGVNWHTLDFKCGYCGHAATLVPYAQVIPASNAPKKQVKAKDALTRKYKLLVLNGQQLKARCAQCNGEMLFLPEYAGETAVCIHCKEPIKLYLPEDLTSGMGEIMQVYLSKPHGQREGPYKLEQIKRDLAAKKYRDTDYWAWHEGLPKWVPLYALPGVSA